MPEGIDKKGSVRGPCAGSGDRAGDGRPMTSVIRPSGIGSGHDGVCLTTVTGRSARKREELAVKRAGEPLFWLLTEGVPLSRQKRRQEGMLQIVLEVLRHFVHEVDAVAAEDVVLCEGVGEVVYGDFQVYAALDEAEAVLPHHGVVHGALADEELALEVLGLSDEGSGLEAFRVGLGVVHVALSVHDFIPFPVYDRAAGHAHLEHVRIGGEEADGHEAAVAPAVYANPGGIHVRQAAEPVDAHHLVFHLGEAAAAVDGLLEGGAAVLCAPVVLDIDQITLLGHEHLPHADVAQPGVLDHLTVRSAIDIQDDGILPGRVEVLGIDEPIIVLKPAVGGGDGAQFHLAGGIVPQRILSHIELLVHLSVRGTAEGHGGGGGIGPDVQQPAAVRRELHMVPAPAGGKLHRLGELGLLDRILAGNLQRHLVKVVLHRRILGRCIEDGAAVIGQVLDIGRCGGKPADGAQRIHQVKVSEAVPVVRAVEEDVCASLDEIQRVQRFHPGLVVLREEGAHIVAVAGPVLVQLQVVLAAVQNLGKDVLGIRAPGDVGDIALRGEIVHLEVGGVARGKVVYAHGHFFGVHPVHGILDLPELSGAGLDVQEREPANLVLVFAVEGHGRAVRAHVPAIVDAELVAAHRFSIDQVGAVGGGYHEVEVLLEVLGIEAAFLLVEGISALGMTGGLVGDGAVGLKEQARSAGIAYPPVDGFLHGEVLARMGFSHIDDAVLRKRKSAGAKDTCSQDKSSHTKGKNRLL